MGANFSSYRTVILSLGILNLILAAMFLIWSNSLMRLNTKLKKWISTEKIEKALNNVRDIDSRIINMRKVLGLLCILLAVTFIFLYIRL